MYGAKERIGLMALLVLATGCATVPETTRTGTIHDVTFDEALAPATLQVRPGDEIRWVNQRAMSVTLNFLEGALDDISCEQGFSRRGLANLRGRVHESATIQPNESVSLCFASPGTVSYNARMGSAVAGGEEIERGTINVR